MTVKADGHINSPPNYTKRIIGAFVGQLMLVMALFVWSDFLPSWINRLIVATVFLLPLLAYLTVLARTSTRQAWRNLLMDSGVFAVSAGRALGRLFHPDTAMKLARFMASLKPVPNTVDEWITFCVLPFKTCIVATFPIIWIFEKLVSYSHYYRPYGRTFGLSFEIIFEGYLFSLLALLLGAMLQAIFCHTGRATTTLRFFLLGLVLLFVLTFIPGLASF